MKETWKEACEHLGIDPKSINVNLCFTSVRKIKKINYKHRGVNKPTDVLSFPLLDIKPGVVPSGQQFPLDINHESGKIELGDIVICRRVAKRQAKQIGQSLDRELAFLQLHGFLHLLGYDHIDAESEKIMTKLQREILKMGAHE